MKTGLNVTFYFRRHVGYIGADRFCSDFSKQNIEIKHQTTSQIRNTMFLSKTVISDLVIIKEPGEWYSPLTTNSMSCQWVKVAPWGTDLRDG